MIIYGKQQCLICNDRAETKTVQDGKYTSMQKTYIYYSTIYIIIPELIDLRFSLDCSVWWYRCDSQPSKPSYAAALCASLPRS